ncbi:hypothetical protein B5C34_12140 [Pacificimonas flava]|uniref:Uncharacterized protein n=2 Tax=Pacificimonas TaxID=1960290 RepID=A0A219B7P9_9SPHN|nr:MULTISPECIES: hypothetical protein [Pacificimonas]MBZ6378585.1 hypothetical protein [Pacificimonas aurantium]OWV34136.1 hypothetical protein B5C34_12140 [Pacificimonas flava]
MRNYLKTALGNVPLFATASLALAASMTLSSPAVAQSASTAEDVYEIGKWVIPTVGLTDLAIDAISKPKQVKRYTHPACAGAKPICGVLVYANAGGYTVTSVSVKAKSSQPFSTPPTHAACAAVNRKLKADVKLNTYDTFVLPADCAYKLQINISGGPKKDRDVFLTPGCLVQAYTDGTTLQNEWHKKIKWMKGSKPEGGDDSPDDPLGNKCSVS